MSADKKDTINSENFLEKKLNLQEDNYNTKSNPETKLDDNINNNKATIEMKKEINNKKRKKIKIRAYCNKCYQFFENGPYSKICQNHLQKKCDLIECQKFNKDGENSCIRKFTNINSANRHTHCLNKKDIELWDTKCQIQKCLGKKKEHDNKFVEIINNNDNNNDDNDNNEKDDNKNFIIDINNINNNSIQNNSYINMNNLFIDNNNSFFDNNNNVMGLIEDIDKLHFNDNNNNNVMWLIEDIDKLHFNNNDKNEDNEEINNIFKKQKSFDNNYNNNCSEDKNENIKEKINKSENFENLSIDEFFEIVKKETNIPNNIKKKLVNAFKKKGILNVKILLLFYEKYKNWDFLINKFKKVSSQIEGVALCIEYLLKKCIKPNCPIDK